MKSCNAEAEAIEAIEAIEATEARVRLRGFSAAEHPWL